MFAYVIYFSYIITMDEDYIDKRRLLEGSLHQQVSNNLSIRRNPLTKQTDFKKKVKFSKAEYTFLQFHHVIWKWATLNNKLTPRELGILLYVHPLITFTSQEYAQMLVELGSTDQSVMSKFKRDGWINIWSKKGNTVNYTLSNKANTLINRMHKMYMLEEEIPLSARRNIVVRKKTKKNEELMRLFSKFNEIVKQKDNENKEKRTSSKKWVRSM